MGAGHRVGRHTSSWSLLRQAGCWSEPSSQCGLYAAVVQLANRQRQLPAKLLRWRASRRNELNTVSTFCVTGSERLRLASKSAEEVSPCAADQFAGQPASASPSRCRHCPCPPPSTAAGWWHSCRCHHRCRRGLGHRPGRAAHRAVGQQQWSATAVVRL